MTNQQFIETIAPYAQKYSKQYGFKLCSAAIAQACLESGYGTSSKAQRHNYFGLKYRPNRVTCSNGTFVDGSKEQQQSGAYVDIKDQWFSFANMETGVEGYYQFINISNYAAVKTANTPLEYLQAIKNAGYATSLDYVQNVMNVVQKWNLQKYDNAATTTISSNISNTNLNILKITSTENTTQKINRPIQWIVLHYTAGTRSSGGTAKSTANYFARPTTKASADFIVDDEQIVQYNPDPLNYYCWAVGGKQYTSKSTSLSAKYYGQCTNANSISIEMCSCKTNTSTLNVTDNDWYLTPATISNAIKLTKYLMKLHNIDINHVIMHHMVTGKWCPQPWTKNEGALSGWYNFLDNVRTGTVIVPQAPISQEQNISKFPYLVKINTDTLNVRRGPGTQYSITAQVKRGSVYTIMEEQNGWGRLKSGAGWFKLSYTVPYSGK